MKIACSSPITNYFYEYIQCVNYIVNYQEFQENKWVMQEPTAFGLFNLQENSQQNILFGNHMDMEFQFDEKGMRIKGKFPYQGQT